MLAGDGEEFELGGLDSTELVAHALLRAAATLLSPNAVGVNFHGDKGSIEPRGPDRIADAYALLLAVIR